MNPFQQPIAYVIRHGETALNAANQYRGWQDVPLNAEGHRAAETLANYLSYEPLGRIVCSDLIRARETANAVLFGCRVECPYASPDPNLRPWHIGELAGKKKNAENRAKLQQYIGSPSTVVPNGESLDQFHDRNAVLMQYINTPFQGLPTVIVVHTSNICDLNNHLDEAKHDKPEVDDLVEPGGLIAIYQNEDGSLRIEVKLGETDSEEQSEAS